MHPFEKYVRAHAVDAVQLSILAKVRYTVVWNAMNGIPIHHAQAISLLQTVNTMTGIPYIQGLTLLPIPDIDRFDTIPIPKIPTS